MTTKKEKMFPTLFPTWDEVVLHHEGFYGIVEPKLKKNKKVMLRSKK